MIFFLQLNALLGKIMLLTVLAEQKSKKKINERYLKILLYIMMISLEISCRKIVGTNQSTIWTLILTYFWLGILVEGHTANIFKLITAILSIVLFKFAKKFWRYLIGFLAKTKCNLIIVMWWWWGGIYTRHYPF